MADHGSTSVAHQLPLIPRLNATLHSIHSNPPPPVHQPSSCKKRASVALVLRVRPTYPLQGTYDPPPPISKNDPVPAALDDFFSQDWVRSGEPEVLFIKRAVRTGDRWTGHIALPGGKREPQDESDQVASIRETQEEVGLDLNTEHCLYIGKLPERVITAHWGKIPIMVLCPFIYLLRRHDTPPLSLQPSEVHSTHWVPLRSLLSPELRTYERADITDRLKPQRGPLAKYISRLLVGEFVFRATFLAPSESLYSTTTTASTPTVHNSLSVSTISSVQNLVSVVATTSTSLLSRLNTTLSSLTMSRTNQAPQQQPLRLWGLTLGIVSDLLHDLDPAATQNLWLWPTFSHWDIRLIVWLMTWRIRRFRRRPEPPILPTPSNDITSRADTTTEQSPETAVDQKPGEQQEEKEADRIDGMDGTTYTTVATTTTTTSSASNPSPLDPPPTSQTPTGPPSADILDIYFGRMYEGVVYAVAARVTLAAAIATYLLIRRRRRVAV